MKQTAYVKIRVSSFPDIEERARQYDMQPKELVAYHNQHCGISDVLTLTLPKYVEFLYLPRTNYNAMRARSLESNTLYYGQDQSEKEYGVLLKFPLKSLELSYTIACKREGQKLLLTKSQTYVDGEAISSSAVEIMAKAESSLYPLHIRLRQDGGIADVINSEEIAQRWNEEGLAQLQAYYQSVESDSIIAEINKALLAVNPKVDLFKQNQFYRFFFLSVYRTYPQFKLNAKLSVYIPSLGRSVFYKTTCRLNPEYSTTGKIILRIKGEVEENDSNKDVDKGCINLLYKFHKETALIYAIEGDVKAIAHGEKHEFSFHLFELKPTTV